TVAGLRHKPLGQLWEILHAPLMQFWFLYVLFVVSVIAVLLRKMTVSTEMIFFLSMLLLASIFVDLNLGPWGVLYMVRIYSLYFVAGALCRKWGSLEALAQLKSTALLRGAIAAFGLLTLAVLLKVAAAPPLMVLWAGSGILGTLLLSMYLDRRQLFPFLRHWGQHSLEIYLAHTIFSATAAAAAYQLLGPNYLEVEVVVSAVAGMAGPLLLCRLCQRWQLMFLFRL
ncbi:MAG: acyltransferase family protein, partial [Cyanobacteria bacterium J06632_22]